MADDASFEAFPPGRATPRAYQDERFSYVVLRRGPRPPDGPDVSIRRQLISQPDLDPDDYRRQPNALNSCRARRLVRSHQRMHS